MSKLDFQLLATASGSKARASVFRTLHGEIRAPLFMPVGTRASVRNQSFDSIEASGTQIMLANTYHLLLRPGHAVFKKMGGIHGLMNWNKSVLTDSGGFQIFSLPNSRKMTEEGAEFISYVDKRKILLTPELSIETQKVIGSDIMMALDQCVPSIVERDQAEEAMHLTHRWAKRSLAAKGDTQAALFGIVQGASFTDLRKQSAAFLTDLPFDGFAIGGLAVGEPKAQREEIAEFSADLLPRNLPRYLMGVGTPIDLLESVHRGIDMFDCILPNALAQRGVAYTWKGKIQLRRGVYRFAEEPLDPDCECGTCTRYSRAYLHHLLKSEEPLMWQLVGNHNLYFYHGLMNRIRESILNDTFLAFYKKMKQDLQNKDEKYLGEYSLHESSREECRKVFTIMHQSSGELMHSSNDPFTEAKELYIAQSNLNERLAEEGHNLVIWDVGLGAATNAMAAIIECEKDLNSRRKLEIVSFENDLDSLKLALTHKGHFQHLQHPAPSVLLEKGIWTNEKVEWKLLKGDFLERMNEGPIPDLIFFDPFSFKTNEALWSLESFKSIMKRCENHATLLFTYSNSTLVRARLLCAGFFIAKGKATGSKNQTTIAMTRKAVQTEFEKNRLPELLSQDWLTKWARSGVFHSDLDPELRKHDQFNFTHGVPIHFNHIVE